MHVQYLEQVNSSTIRYSTIQSTRLRVRHARATQALDVIQGDDDISALKREY